MTPDLQELLRLVVPEPPTSLDPEQALRKARRAQSSRRLAGTLTATSALVIAAALVVTNLPHDRSTSSLSAPVLSALDRPVPLGPVALGFLRGLGPDTGSRSSPRPSRASAPVYTFKHPGRGSLVGSIGSDQIYLLDTTTDDLCLIEVNESYGSAGGGCQPRSDLLEHGITQTTNYPPWSTTDVIEWHLVVVAPDGYTTASSGGHTADVRNNIAIIVPFPSPAGGQVTLTGPGVNTLHYTVGSR